MFEPRITEPAQGVRQYRLARGASPLTYADVLGLWSNDDTFRRFFIDLLRDSPFPCYRFETPPLTRDNADRDFELVLVDSPEIDLRPDSRDFDAHFERLPGDVVVFPNLGGDATMVVPRPLPGVPGYAHIAGFSSHAPVEQQLLLWRIVGETVLRELGAAPLWLNTAGGGVPWLHVRLDSRPKYYVFDHYKRYAAPTSL